jgi:uncharacterized membrane protein
MLKAVTTLASASFFGIFWFSKQNRKDVLLMIICLALFAVCILTIVYKMHVYEQELKKQGRIKKTSLWQWLNNKELVEDK